MKNFITPQHLQSDWIFNQMCEFAAKKSQEKGIDIFLCSYPELKTVFFRRNRKNYPVQHPFYLWIANLGYQCGSGKYDYLVFNPVTGDFFLVAPRSVKIDGNSCKSFCFQDNIYQKVYDQNSSLICSYQLLSGKNEAKPEL